MSRVVPSLVVDLITKVFPWTNMKSHGQQQVIRTHAQYVYSIVELVEQIPDELITLEGSSYVEFVVAKSTLLQAVRSWEHNGDRPINNLPYFGDIHPITLMRRCLESCPDEFPSAATAELNFIEDEQLRKALRLDIDSVNRALANGEWKAATVLAGSAIEALLLWKVTKQPESDVNGTKDALLERKELDRKPPAKLDDWTLFPLLTVARELRVIAENTATECDLAKDFRNLVHPGRAQKLNQRCDRGTALETVAALEHVVRDLEMKNE